MAVMINDINVKNLGPILDDINWKLGKLNLIYGKNETGKTFLVEFLIRSLFQSKEWTLRPPLGTGKITVTGLEDSPISLSPSSSQKFDDYYENVIGGLPPDFSKLLVIKGADVDLNEGEPDKVFIKRYLSSKEILDTIEERISKTVQNAIIEDNQIIGDNRGEIKKLSDLNNRLKNIDALFQEVNRDYLGGERKTFENKLKKAQENLEEMKKAKKHLANTLAKQIEDLEAKQREIDDGTLEEVGRRLNTFQQKQSEYQTKQGEYETAKEQNKEYSWVKNSTDTYDKQLSQTSSSKTNIILLVPLIGLIALTVIFAYFNIFVGVLASVVGVGIAAFFIIRGYQKIAHEGGKTEELENIYKEYEKRFGESLSGLPQMKTKLEELKTVYDNCEFLKKQLSEDNSVLKQFQGQLTQDFKQMFGKEINPSKWEEALQSVKKEKKEWDSKIRELEPKLSQLNVDEGQYLEETASVEYNHDEYLTLGEDVTRLNEEINGIESKLKTLRSNICLFTGDDINIGWGALLERLRNKHDETLKELKDITAEIIGKIAVIDVLKEFREAEDEKIKKSLETDVISQPLKDVTNRYIGFKLEGDNLYVNDSFNDFKLDEISTGAREQVLLALRMGFCSRILNQDKLFLILDDAFQYSDWTRRRLLIGKVVDLAKNGWQILYFTMDDHIKQLFDEKGKSLGDEYKSFVLKEA